MTVAGSSTPVTAAALAARMRRSETPDDVIRSRLALAARVAAEARATEPVDAAIVVGSTALRRCSERADLDLVLLGSSASRADRFTSQTIDGVRVEVERVSQSEALACTTGQGWVWELRQAARLGCSVPVLDDDGLAAELTRRASAMKTSPDRVEATLRDVYLLLIHLRRGDGDPFRRMDALRGCLDNLALLALLERPRRYQKAKWALADLLHAGEDALVEAIVVAYGIGADDAASARATVAGAQDLIGGAFSSAGVPSHEEILARGHAPDLAEASYVSRALEDAEDLEASGRCIEAQYVAKFAARLAGGLLHAKASAESVVDAFVACDGRDLARRYLTLFSGVPDPDAEILGVALASAEARRRAHGSPAPSSEPMLLA